MGSQVRPFQATDEHALRRVMMAALEVDAYPGFTAWDLEREAVSILGAPAETAVAVEDGILCGYVSPSRDDLTVHPDSRRRGHGRRLFAAGLELVAQEGLDEICLYAPSGGPGRAFAEAMGLAQRSSLWRLALPDEATVPEPAFPREVIARVFGDWLALPAFADLVNLSFADHPSPFSVTPGAIEYTHSRPDFDPTSILILVPADTPGIPIGFGRVALEPIETGGAARLGEIALVGVLPEWRGRGLGRELLRWGVTSLRARGAGHIQLTVEARNERALGLYRRTGFEPEVEWPQWTRPIAAPDSH